MALDKFKNLAAVTNVAVQLQGREQEALAFEYIDHVNALVAFAVAFCVKLPGYHEGKPLPYRNVRIIEKLQKQLVASIPHDEKMYENWLATVNSFFELLFELERIDTAAVKHPGLVVNQQFASIGNTFLTENHIVDREDTNLVWGIDFPTRYLLWCYTKYITKFCTELSSNFVKPAFFPRLHTFISSLGSVLGRDTAFLLKTTNEQGPNRRDPREL